MHIFFCYEVFGDLVSFNNSDVYWVSHHIQPLFPGESGVDQLVEIIKVHYQSLFVSFDYYCFFCFASS